MCVNCVFVCVGRGWRQLKTEGVTQGFGEGGLRRSAGRGSHTGRGHWYRLWDCAVTMSQSTNWARMTGLGQLLMAPNYSFSVLQTATSVAWPSEMNLPHSCMATTATLEEPGGLILGLFSWRMKSWMFEPHWCWSILSLWRYKTWLVSIQSLRSLKCVVI